MIAAGIRPPSRRNTEAFRNWVTDRGLLVHVAVANNDARSSLVIDRLTERVKIADVRTSVIYEHVRNDVITAVH